MHHDFLPVTETFALALWLDRFRLLAKSGLFTSGVAFWARLLHSRHLKRVICVATEAGLEGASQTLLILDDVLFKESVIVHVCDYLPHAVPVDR